MKSSKKNLSPEQGEELLNILKARFEKNMDRHHGLEWPKVQAKLEAEAEKLWSLNEMEKTGGEPDVVGYDDKIDEYIFYDCSAQSPKAPLSDTSPGGGPRCPHGNGQGALLGLRRFRAPKACGGRGVKPAASAGSGPATAAWPP